MKVRLFYGGVVGVIICAVGAASRPAVYAGPPAKEGVADALVREALRSEVYGPSSQRQALLESALRRSPESSAAHWHSGQVRLGDEWTGIDAAAERSAQDATLAEYLRRRGEVSDDAASQLELAKWCRGRGLAPQMRAHLTQVLKFNPDHASARAMLGQQRVEGRWMAPEEILAMRAGERQTVKDLAYWGPRLQRIHRRLTSKSESRRQTAREELGEIRDPGAIGAIERELSSQSREGADAAVGQIAALGGYEAALSLARHAVFASWASARTAAIAELKRYPLDSYVPALLGTMSTPLIARSEFLNVGGGVLRQDLVRREGQYEQQLLAADARYLGDPLAASGQAFDDAEKFRDNVADHNVRIGQLNGRICTVLRNVVSQPQRDEPGRAEPTKGFDAQQPGSWWRWWNDHNEVYLPDEKPLTYNYLGENVTQITPPLPPPGSFGGDCLAAGTPVWTNLGPKPVESVQLGDMVLSQHPETGELAYKPVLGTTVRPPSRLVAIEIDGTTVRASGGHPFWVSGLGWTKARDLESNSPLHRAEGAVPVRAVTRDSDMERTFNLIVADFHTYFVGEARILSHDNTIRQPTNALVPGLTDTVGRKGR